MVAVREGDRTRAFTGNCFGAVKAVGGSIVIRIFRNGADCAFVKADDLNAAAACKGVYTCCSSVSVDCDSGWITRYVVCLYGIYAGVSAGDVEREVESLVLITLITFDGL